MYIKGSCHPLTNLLLNVPLSSFCILSSSFQIFSSKRKFSTCINSHLSLSSNNFFFYTRRTASMLTLVKTFFSSSSTTISPYETSPMFSGIDTSNLLKQKVTATTRCQNEKTKSHVVVLGTGWAAMHFFTNLSTEKYDITVVSPRNYFAFTPLLPSVCSGALSHLACMEPIRPFTRRRGKLTVSFYECLCTDVDFNRNEIVCKSSHGDAFNLSYDYLIVSVGSETNTFNIPGVDKYAYFLKEVEHAVAIRKKIVNHFERAALPSTSLEERERLLHFVVVGGGPTGVEAAAELSDFVKEDMAKYFPELIHLVKVTLVEANSKLLPMFSNAVSEFTNKVFEKQLNIRVLLQHVVTEIKEKSIVLQNKQQKYCDQSQSIELDNGFVIWASGVGQTKLAKNIIDKIEQQKGNKVMKVNSRLQLIGTDNVYALGDCASIEPNKLADNAKELFNEASKTGNHSKWLKDQKSKLSLTYPQLSPLKWDVEKNPIPICTNFDDFFEYLSKIDKAYRSPSPTAQNARQEGVYLAKVFNKYITEKEKMCANAFQEKWSGSLAYVGRSQAVATLPKFDILGGFFSLTLWKAVYTQLQMTWRSRSICLFDWLRSHIAGKNLGTDNQFN